VTSSEIYNFADTHWDFTGLLKDYQTLHPVDQAIADNQYARLPEFKMGTQYPLGFSNASFLLGGDAVNFYEARTPDTTQIPVVGDRLSLIPEVTDPIYRTYGFLTPTVKVNLLKYSVRHTGKLPSGPSDAIPTFDLRGGLYFDRPFSWFGGNYLQVLEPEFFYLLVPNHNQDDLPIFDTTTQVFNYNFMFEDNRFSGLDRVGDANQATFALTTRFINQDTGQQKGSMSIGEIIYFRRRHVRLCSGIGCGKPNSLDRRTLSPIAGKATYNFTRAWALKGELTWNPYSRGFSYESADVSYAPLKDNVVNLNYNRIKSGGAISGEPKGSAENRFQQLGLSAAWTIRRHWDAVAAYNYSWGGNNVDNREQIGARTNNHANVYLAGLGYNSCCWAVRLVGARTFQGVDNRGRNTLQNSVYLQIALKGLGTVGTSSPTSVLQGNINDYLDRFGMIGNEQANVI